MAPVDSAGWIELNEGIFHVCSPKPELHPAIERLRQVMQLPRCEIESTEYVHKSDIQGQFTPLLSSKTASGESIDEADPAEQLARLSMVPARMIQSVGGLLLHAAMLEWQGSAYLLAGPGGMGKSTAAGRVTAPWQAFSDDTCMVLPGKEGALMAHPWPTWSRFFEGGPGGNWQVNHSAPVKAVCFLNRGEVDRLEPMEEGEVVGSLFHAAEQVSWAITERSEQEERRQVRLVRFENAWKLSRQIKAYRLYVTLTGAFWILLESIP